jgi:Tol biopolymer transport system component
LDRLSPSVESKTSAIHERLDSWKAIAAYLKRDVSTVQRWERREGMPVHRHLHDKQGSVYAYRSDLDAWWERRRTGLKGEEVSSKEAVAEAASVPPPTAWTPRLIGSRGPLLIAGAILIAAALGAYWITTHHEAVEADPLLGARVTQLTDSFDTRQAATISRDGRFVAFLAEVNGHPDAYVTEIGTGQFRNLTQGRISELINPSIRPLGFSPDGSLVTIWSRTADGSRPGDVNILTIPRIGGAPESYLAGAAEVTWSSDGRRLVYHTTAPGDPIFVKSAGQASAQQIYVGPAGVHCHFPLWSADDEFIYFVRGVPPDDWDIWRVRASGEGLERITAHHSLVSHPVLLDRNTLGYLASDAQHSGPWLFSVDVEGHDAHRIGFGLEHYTSLAASADGKRLVATASKVHSGLSRLSLSDSAGETSIVSSATSPRFGPDYLVYVSTTGGRLGIWKLANGKSEELWSAKGMGTVGGLAIAPGGRQIAFTMSDAQKTRLLIMNSAGGQVRTVADTLQLHGNLAWAPDGRSIVAAVDQQGEPRLMKIPLDGSAPLSLVAEYSLDPSWSPDGQFLIYSGPDVGTTFALRAVAADGRPYPLPPIMLSRGARRVAFWRDSQSLLVLRGDVDRKNFWIFDLKTGADHQLGELTSQPTIGDFDVSPSGDEIVFERIQERSEIAVIERAQ